MDLIGWWKKQGKEAQNKKIMGSEAQGKMQSPSRITEASQACFHGCCPTPFLAFPELQTPTTATTSGGTTVAPQHHFLAATTSSLHPHPQFTNHESLPPLAESFSNFKKAFPQYSNTNRADQIRAHEYFHLSISNRVCLDYIGHCLFSYSQQQIHRSTPHFPFFDIMYKSVGLSSQLLYNGQESEFESKLRKRITGFMNIPEEDYSMVFTANKSSAFKLLAESYPFDTQKNLVTVYDYESDSVEAMIETSMKRGARVKSAEFSWPNLRIQYRKLRKMVVSKSKKRKKGLFVFPLQSSVTGARYSYLWMNIAQENGWHVLLDATALGAKDMETLGLSLFKPDFLICSFFKIFGENPSGFGCLFIKKSIASVFRNSRIETSRGIVSLVPVQSPEFKPPEVDFSGPSSSSATASVTPQQQSGEISEIQESKETEIERKESFVTELECRGLDHADSIGLILISSRTRYLINWLVNAFLSLKHPHSENGLPLVKIYGPKVRVDRGPAVAFNVYDWKGERIDPQIVQKLADRNSISLSMGFLHRIWFSDKHVEEGESLTVGSTRRDDVIRSGIHVVTASLGFLTDFEDMYRLWAFVSRFLDADFVEKERWRYMALNQSVVEV